MYNILYQNKELYKILLKDNQEHIETAVLAFEKKLIPPKGASSRDARQLLDIGFSSAIGMLLKPKEADNESVLRAVHIIKALDASSHRESCRRREGLHDLMNTFDIDRDDDDEKPAITLQA